MRRTRAWDSGGALVLFTRDLRLNDHQALGAAMREHEFVVPVFVLDRELLRGSCGSPNRVAFLLESLHDLDRSLRQRGARLIVRRGEVVQETMRLVHESRLSAVHMSADLSPYAQARHARLSDACERARVELRTHPGINIVPPGGITPKGGDHYRVFTPYWRVWSTLEAGPVASAPGRIAMGAVARPGSLPRLVSLAPQRPSPHLQEGGESAGRAQLERWLKDGAERYEELRHELLAETSRLSAYLHFGCLSAREVLERGSRGPAGSSFARQLCWRDFHHQVLAARPDISRRDYRPRGDQWCSDELSAQAWRDGNTGYPVVDAAMRQLAREGYMHNRARLIAGSFLTKTLYLDWRLGAAHFATLLQDADLANNVGNWQWIAGTGNDPRPNRVLNPTSQGKRLDPLGAYVRRYVPELASIDGPAVHEPWRLDPAVRRTLGYPEPIVDHAAAAAEFRARRQAPSAEA